MFRRFSYVLVVALMTGLILHPGSASAAAGAAVTTRSASSDTLAALNYYRSSAGVISGSTASTLSGVSENPALSSDDAAHGNYMVQNGLTGHSEDPSNPYYSVAGDTAARNSVLSMFSSANQPASHGVSLLMTSPFHALDLLDPKMVSTGVANVSGNGRTATAIDVFRGLTGPGASGSVVWPGPGASVPDVGYSGGESPNPLTSCSGYNSSNTGLPIIVRLNTVPSGTTATLRSGSSNVPVCVFDENNYVNPDPAQQSLARSVMHAAHGVVIVPQNTLSRGATYNVNLSSGGTNLAWSFATSTSAAVPTLSAGYWGVTSKGQVDARGSATWYGDVSTSRLNAPIVAMTATPSGHGYWLLGADGGIFSFGDAGFYGSTGAMALNAPVVGMAATPSGRGYWILARDGGIFSFGDAGFYGSTGSLRLNAPVVDMTVSASGHGYRLVATDGGVFCFGDAGFYGSTGSMRLNKPVTSMASSPSGSGYWMIGSDGGIFSFGPSADFYGSLYSAERSVEGGVRIRSIGAGNGYFILTGRGHLVALGRATNVGDVTPGSVDFQVVPGT